jgi:hypothetical protein
MRRFTNAFSLANKLMATRGPVLIAVGLCVLLSGMNEAALPPVTGMACVALGATLATISRFNGSRLLSAAAAAHLLIYASLYSLFVGAVFHTVVESGPKLSFIQSLDIGLSILPMYAAVRVSCAAIAAGADAPAR